MANAGGPDTREAVCTTEIVTGVMTGITIGTAAVTRTAGTMTGIDRTTEDKVRKTGRRS
jgi:hypothetical protein